MNYNEYKQANPNTSQINSITVIGRKWFDKVNGNTYHTARIMVNGETVGRIPFSYGYDDMYVQNATVWLKDNGFITFPEGHDYYPLWSYCRDNNIHYEYFAEYMPRKKDLNF